MSKVKQALVAIPSLFPSIAKTKTWQETNFWELVYTEINKKKRKCFKSRIPEVPAILHRPIKIPTTPDFCIPILEVLAKRTGYQQSVPAHEPTKEAIVDLKNEILRHMGIDPDNPPFPLEGRKPKGLHRRIYLAFWNLRKDKEGRIKQFAQYRNLPKDSRSFYCKFVKDKATGMNLWALNWAGVDVVLSKKKQDWGNLLTASNEAEQFISFIVDEATAAPLIQKILELRQKQVQFDNISSVWLRNRDYYSFRKSLEKALNARCQQSLTMGLVNDHMQEWDTVVMGRDRLRKQLLKNKGAGVNIPPSTYAAWGCRTTYTGFRDDGQDAAMRSLRGSKTQTERAKEEEQRKKWEPRYDEKTGTYIDPSQNLGRPVFPTQHQQSGDIAPVTYTSSEEEGGASIREFTDPSTVSPEDEVAMEESLRNIENLLRERLADKADSHILVMSLMATDSTPSEIAEELGISRQQAQTMMKTVRTTLADLRPE
jgi:hypothetical protein